MSVEKRHPGFIPSCFSFSLFIYFSPINKLQSCECSAKPTCYTKTANKALPPTYLDLPNRPRDILVAFLYDLQGESIPTRTLLKRVFFSFFFFYSDDVLFLYSRCRYRREKEKEKRKTKRIRRRRNTERYLPPYLTLKEKKRSTIVPSPLQTSRITKNIIV